MFKKYLIILGVSMLPIVELRGAIPCARAMDVSVFQALPIAVIGNILPVPFIILFFNFFFTKFRSTKLLGSIFSKVHDKALAQASKIESYAFWGLYIFVAIPLPGTGAWTGSVVASLLNMNNKKAFLAILAGVVTSGIIMSLLAYFLPDLFIKLFS